MQKVALITGASSGIGAASAVALLDAGFTVYCAARRIERMSELQTRGGKLLYLDLTQSESIALAVETILAQEKRLDVLVNNAGYGSYGALEEIPMSEARRQFEVNLFGVAELIKCALPAMRAAGSGRIINVTSIGGKVWSPYGSWYQATKFALEGLSDCLRNELRPFGIQVVVIEPGAIKSEWARIAIDNIKSTATNPAYAELTRRIVTFYTGVENTGAPPDTVAKAIVHAASARTPKIRYVVPTAAKLFIFLRWLLSDRLFDRMMNSFAKLPATHI